jgi:hypothetical protein
MLLQEENCTSTCVVRRGYTLRSNMDLMMERTEKTTEAMGMEGRQATLYHASPDYHQIS